MDANVIEGDVREALRTLPDESVQCCVTSPPYWGLRDYQVEGQIGLEESLDEYITTMVGVFREVRRVLRKDGLLWLNLGDAYASGGRKERDPGRIKPKDLLGIPWRVAFALQDDGWWLRQDNIWHKPNPMPESVKDRCTKAHEYVFMFAKSKRYYFDAEAISEPASGQNEHDLTGGYYNPPGQRPHSVRRSGNKERKPASARGVPVGSNGSAAGAVAGSVPWEGTRRNKRSVWTITAEHYEGAHFATFPSALPRICIAASTRHGDLVLDPFAGSGTTLAVALELGRRAVGIELNPEYVKLIRSRIASVSMALPLVGDRHLDPVCESAA